jgi:hypothetical protein
MSLIQRKRGEIGRVGGGVPFAARYQHRCTNEYLCPQPRSKKSFFFLTLSGGLADNRTQCPATVLQSIIMFSVMTGTTLPLPQYDSSMPWTCFQKPLQSISVTRDSTPSVTHQFLQVHSHSKDVFKHVSLSFAHASYYRILVTHAWRQLDSYVPSVAIVWLDLYVYIFSLDLTGRINWYR